MPSNLDGLQPRDWSKDAVFGGVRNASSVLANHASVPSPMTHFLLPTPWKSKPAVLAIIRMDCWRNLWALGISGQQVHELLAFRSRMLIT